MANRYMKKCSCVSDHKGNANQNDTEISHHFNQNGYQPHKQQQRLERMWGKGTLIHYWWECKRNLHTYLGT
jgi:hypothetical protein